MKSIDSILLKLNVLKEVYFGFMDKGNIELALGVYNDIHMLEWVLGSASPEKTPSPYQIKE